MIVTNPRNFRVVFMFSTTWKRTVALRKTPSISRHATAVKWTAAQLRAASFHCDWVQMLANQSVAGKGLLIKSWKQNQKRNCDFVAFTSCWKSKTQFYSSAKNPQAHPGKGSENTCHTIKSEWRSGPPIFCFLAVSNSMVWQLANWMQIVINDIKPECWRKINLRHSTPLIGFLELYQHQ